MSAGGPSEAPDRDEKPAEAREADAAPSEDTNDAKRSGSDRGTGRHDAELDASSKLREPKREEPEPREIRRIRRAPLAPAPAPMTGLESVIAPSSGSERDTESDETTEPTEDLEERVTRSVKTEDLKHMRTLADRVYYEGWGHLSREEQQMFLYHSRFLKYLSADEQRRQDVQSTMYHMLGAQGKSLGLERTYSTRQLSMIADRFFGAVSTPRTRGDLYRAPLDTSTDTYKRQERDR